jgi:ribosomal protein S26
VGREGRKRKREGGKKEGGGRVHEMSCKEMGNTPRGKIFCRPKRVVKKLILLARSCCENAVKNMFWQPEMTVKKVNKSEHDIVSSFSRAFCTFFAARYF